MKLYLVVFAPNYAEGTYMFAESLEFVNDAHVKVTGYFAFKEDVSEYFRLKEEGVKKRTLIIPQSSYTFIEELEV
ncbi:hypothetical protein [Thermovibrio ammonificans]|jgi:hypothetical protein|uniref:Uncharacterized protein n=1 Tax=Thermovibrio ammonificans (strain DSM 15698 / JCM 12110 / HB-1) TaxID=648996 RepID=E8T4L1_THEA1|nr:hypothetical protein [Thermovibrio ammonificans]ADU97469.1 hypothetical protein Theam_1508 [Thermovibrio ammonificans HB-1]